MVSVHAAVEFIIVILSTTRTRHATGPEVQSGDFRRRWQDAPPSRYANGLIAREIIALSAAATVLIVNAWYGKSDEGGLSCGYCGRARACRMPRARITVESPDVVRGAVSPPVDACLSATGRSIAGWWTGQATVAARRAPRPAVSGGVGGRHADRCCPRRRTLDDASFACRQSRRRQRVRWRSRRHDDPEIHSPTVGRPRVRARRSPGSPARPRARRAFGSPDASLHNLPAGGRSVPARHKTPAPRSPPRRGRRRRAGDLRQ